MHQPDPVARMLVSYYYRGKCDLGQIVDMEAALGRAGGRLELFADSGAFSAFTQRRGGASIKREEYAAWLTEWQDQLKIMVNLDVIGDAKASARNQLWLEDRGLPVLPVYHMQSPLSELEALCRDYDYICIGGTASLTGTKKLAATARAMLIAREHGTRVHGLGRSASEELASLPFYSADSTTWTYGARFGSLQVFTGSRVASLPVQEAVRHPVLIRSHGADPQRMAVPAYGNRGKSLGIMKDQGDYRREVDESVFVAAVAWKRLEAHLRARHRVPPPPGQESTGTNLWLADNAIRHFAVLVRAVSWLAETST